MRRRLQAVFGGSIGNLVEWYDWYAYSAFAPFFAHSFFPAGDRTSELLKTAGVFALGFLIRPIGGWAMGVHADRHGRKAALTLSVTLMCLGSLLVACAPTYASIGLGAPIVLVIARLLQGFSVGGEYGTSATYLAEVAAPERRGFYSSFLYVTLIMGQVIALAVLVVLQFALLGPDQLRDWGWRIPFLIGALCAAVAFWLRRSLSETESFAARNRTEAGSLRVLLVEHPREVLVVIGMTVGGTVAFYTYTTYMQKFLILTVHLSDRAATLVSAASLLIFMLLQPVVGLLSDFVGRRPVLLAFGALGTLLTVPLLQALSATRSPWTAFALIMAALVIVSGYTSINAIVKAELFPAEIRALGIGLPYALTVSIFGGTTEFVALWCKSAHHESIFYWYVTACIACSLGVYANMRETRRTSRIER
jgi:MHS family alpha-ketoglutarate permease-like MFS transporter